MVLFNESRHIRLYKAIYIRLYKAILLHIVEHLVVNKWKGMCMKPIVV